MRIVHKMSFDEKVEKIMNVLMPPLLLLGLVALVGQLLRFAVKFISK